MITSCIKFYHQRRTNIINILKDPVPYLSITYILLVLKFSSLDIVLVIEIYKMHR